MRRPDLRNLLVPRLSGAPLTASEIDYDDLVVHRSYRSFDPVRPGEVRYLMYELSQKNPGSDHYTYFWKAVRLARVTRVPRYLRMSTSQGPNMVFEQQRDILAALRENQVLFLNVIAKSDALPMIFAYGVQGVGNSPEEAQAHADEGWAVLTFQLDGVFQQLEYRQLTLEQAEALVRYQNEWDHIAMARGRPVPAGGNFGSANLFDGNRTEVQSTLNQLESFMRGMGDKEFMLSLVTVPLSPVDMTLAWQNISDKLGAVRSEQQGIRSISAAVALPISLGQSLANSSGSGNSVGSSTGVGYSQGTNQTFTDAQSVGTSVGTSHATALGQSLGLGQSTSHSLGVSQGTSNSVNQTTSVGNSQTDSTGQSLSAGLSSSSGISKTGSESTSSSLSAGANWGTNFGTSLSNQSGSQVHGGLPGVLGGGQSTSAGTGQNAGQSSGNSLSQSLTGSTSSSTGVSASQSQSLSQGASWGTSLGVNTAQSLGVGRTESLGTNEGVSTGLSLNKGISNTVSDGVSNSQSQSTSVSNAAGTSSSTSQNAGLLDSSSSSFGQTMQTSAGVGAVPSLGVSESRTVFNETKRILGDVLDAQMRRYLEGVEGGAFLYQMFLIAPDRATLMGAAGLLKSSFWGLGTHEQRLPQPFHTITEFEDDERLRLLSHAAAFTQYRRREPAAELIEPHFYSSYVTMMEAAAFCHPPTSESLGIMGMVDSMPVLAMPANRQHREISLGRIVNGERARVSDTTFSLDADELTHTLLAGVTGIGKTTTLMTMLAEISRVRRTVVERASVTNPMPTSREVKAGILGLDWARYMRDLGSVVEPDRFRFYSIAKPELGEFRWNPLALPDDHMDPVEWASDMADNMTISFSLGEFGRSLIAELISDLYSANRLEPFALRTEVRDPNTGVVLREGVYLPALDRDALPASAIMVDADGNEVANVLTFPALSRLISMADLATLVLNKVEEAATVEGARLHGAAFRDRIQSLWRRVQYFAPGSMFSTVFACDAHLDERTTLSVSDLIDPDKGLVTIIEADGLDLTNRRFILGSVLLAVWRYGQFRGEGCFNHNGQGPGTFVCLEEAHELFGEQEDDDRFSAGRRTALYESMFRRSRALGMKLVAVVQNSGSIPEAVTSNTTTVMIQRQMAENDRKRAFSLLNWDHMIGAQVREWRYLGEMAQGYLIVRMDAKESYLESAPVQIKVEPAALAKVTDDQLRAWAANRNW
jgi:DNA helicase HerA-like ATPase